MAIQYLTYSSLVAQGRAELRRQIPEIDPTIHGSFSNAFVSSSAALAYSNELLIRDLEKQMFPQTAEGEFLDTWGGYEALPRLVASSSIGSISIPGSVGVTVPIATSFRGSNGFLYTSTAVGTVQTVAQAVLSITRVGLEATVTTDGDHTLASGLDVVISGAVETAYNGTFNVTVTALDQFVYTVSGNPSTPATGTLACQSNYAIVELQSDETGIQSNLLNGALLTIDSPITNLSNTGFAQFEGLSGGADDEGDDAYRERILLSRSIQNGVFTADQVRLAALGVAGNTRAFVVRPRLSTCAPPVPGFIPTAGQVAVYILRDNDINIIPTQAILDLTKQEILEKGRLPSHTYEGDVFVFAPNTVPVDFDFITLNPDTSTMRQAVINQINAFFEDTIDFEEDVLEAAYLGAIQNTQDLQTGEFIQSFALSDPTGNININSGEIATIGNVTFSV